MPNGTYSWSKERRDSQAERTKSYTPQPLPPSPGKIRRQRTKAERPWSAGQGQVPAHLHIPMPHPWAPTPRDRLHNRHHIFPLLVLRVSPREPLICVLGNVHTAGCCADTKMRRPLPRLHDFPVTGSSEVSKSLRTPRTQHSLSPPACYPCPDS